MRLGLIGIGYWGKNWVKTLHGMGHLGGVADLSAELRGQFVTDFPGIPCHAAVEDLLASDVTGIVIATPPHTHRDLALQAIEAGKHVLIEKPLSDTSIGAQEIVEAAQSRGVAAMVGHVYEFHGAIEAIKAAVEAGQLGALRRIYLTRHNFGIVRPDVDAAWNLAPHDLSIAALFSDGTMPEVRAVGQSWLQPGIADAAEITLRFAEGYEAQVSVSWMSPVKRREVLVVGDRGLIHFEDGPKAHLTYHAKWYDTNAGMHMDDGTAQIAFDATPPLQREAEAFLAACRGEPVRSSAQSGAHVVQLLEEITHQINQGLDAAAPHGT